MIGKKVLPDKKIIYKPPLQERYQNVLDAGGFWGRAAFLGKVFR